MHIQLLQTGKQEAKRKEIVCSKQSKNWNVIKMVRIDGMQSMYDNVHECIAYRRLARSTLFYRCAISKASTQVMETCKHVYGFENKLYLYFSCSTFPRHWAHTQNLKYIPYGETKWKTIQLQFNYGKALLIVAILEEKYEFVMNNVLSSVLAFILHACGLEASLLNKSSCIILGSP